MAKPRAQPVSRPMLPARRLRSVHIFMIGVSGTVGVGFFTSAGEILGIAGPGGVLLAFGVVGFVSCMVMEGICEMLVHWAIPNPMVEFVRVFVDRDLAIVVGFAYWYTYAITFAALVITCGDLCDFWSLSFAWKSAIFVLLPITIFPINSRSVLFFGNIELAGGALKLILVLGLFILMICLDQGVGPGERLGATFFNDGVRDNPSVADSHFKACLIGISLAVFPYIGIESITVTAFEAKSPERSLRFAAKNLAYFITAIYFASVIAFALNVEWFNTSLEEYFDQPLVDVSTSTNEFLGHDPALFEYYDLQNGRSRALPVIAILQSGITFLPGFVTACLVYSALSAANSALYIASRTMYGLAQSLDPDSRSPLVRVLSRLGTVTPDTKVPGWALLLSCMFLWVPFLHVDSGHGRAELQQILISIGSTSCVLVWASQCLAFIRYHSWRKQHKENLREGQYTRYHPSLHEGFHSWFAYWQPLPAVIGLVGCILIVLVFASVGMWNRQHLLIKTLTIYLGPAILLCMFIILKLINRRKWVVLGDWAALRSTLNGLENRVLQPSDFNGADNTSDDGGSGFFSTTGDGGGEADAAHQFERFSQEAHFEALPPVAPAPYGPDQIYPMGRAEGSRESSTGNARHWQGDQEEGYGSDGSAQFLRPANRAYVYAPDGSQPQYEHVRHLSGTSELGT